MMMHEGRPAGLKSKPVRLWIRQPISEGTTAHNRALPSFVGTLCPGRYRLMPVRSPLLLSQFLSIVRLRAMDRISRWYIFKSNGSTARSYFTVEWMLSDSAFTKDENVDLIASHRSSIKWQRKREGEGEEEAGEKEQELADHVCIDMPSFVSLDGV